jgi:hypothetical protein
MRGATPQLPHMSLWLTQEKISLYFCQFIRFRYLEQHRRLFQNDYVICYSKILSVVLYGCETWSLTLREERRMRVFDHRVFRRIFGPKRNEVTGERRKLHNVELNLLAPESSFKF